MKILKVVTIIAATLTLGACAGTAELEPGTIGDSTLAVYGKAAPQLPANWQVLRSATGDEPGLAYGCRPEECSNPGLIGYKALRVGGNIEAADAVIPVSPALLHAVSAQIAGASGATVSNIKVSRVNQSGTVAEQTMVISKKQRAYAIVRVTRLPNEVHTVFAAGMTPAQARQYMDIALAGVK